MLKIWMNNSRNSGKKGKSKVSKVQIMKEIFVSVTIYWYIWKICLYLYTPERRKIMWDIFIFDLKF